MLDNLRNFATTWPGKILGALLLIGLAGFGITGVITSIGSNTIARVGDRDISTLDFQRAYQRQVNIAAQQIGSVPTPEQALSLGIPNAVLNRLATDAAMNILSDEFSLGVSDNRLAEGLRADPAFSGTLGNFDREIFERSMRQNGITENDFFASRREAATREQIALALFSEARAPQALNQLIQGFGEDRRTLDYFVLNELSLLPIAEPDDAVLQAYLSENQNQYRTQEARMVQAMQLSPQILAARVEISEEEIAAEYERTKQNLFTVERRTITQVQLPSDEITAQFESGLSESKDFATIVSELELTASEIGTFSQVEMTDPRLADTAFGLALNDVSIIPSVSGQRAIIVTHIEPGGQLSLGDATTQITDRLKLAQGRQQFIDVLDQIEEQRAAFIDLAQIAEAFDLSVHEVAIEAGGSALIETMELLPPEAARVASTVFATSEAGLLAPSIPLGANKIVWFDLMHIEDAHDQSLGAVRDALASAWLGEQRTAALEEKALAFVEQLNTGQSMSDLAVINGLFPSISQPVSRNGDGGGIIDAQVAGAAYQGGVGYTDATLNSNGEYVIFIVSSINIAENKLGQDDIDFIQNGYRNNIFADFTSSLRNDAQMSINQGLLSQVLGLGTDSNNRHQ